MEGSQNKPEWVRELENEFMGIVEQMRKRYMQMWVENEGLDFGREADVENGFAESLGYLAGLFGYVAPQTDICGIVKAFGLPCPVAEEVRSLLEELSIGTVNINYVREAFGLPRLGG